jgi:thiosulfate reductase cytochrome b subunit
MLDVVVLIVSGLVLWKSVQFPYLRVLVGGYEGARYVHFAAMSFMVAFILVHVVMALLVPKTIKAMLWGR